MPRNANQSKSSNYSLDFAPTDTISVSGFSTALSNVNNGTRSSDNNLPFSWSVWFRSRNSSNSYGEIAGYGQTQRNGIRIHNNVFRSNYTSDLAGTTTISQNVWYHGVVTYDGTTRRIYINGSLDASDTPSSAAISSQALTIGVYPGGTSSFNGDLNELCYFDYALSASQVTTLYGTGSAIGNPMALSSPPIAYYPLGTSAYNGEYLAENNAIGDYVFDFNPSNSNYINCGDSDDFSFGDGTTDSPFSLSVWVNMTDATKFRILNKAQGTSAGNTKEYLFSTGGDDKIIFYLYQDNISTTRIGQKYNGAALTSYEGQWIHLVGTYDGSSSANGIKIYLNGIQVDDTPVTGAYTAMQNTNEPFVIGQLTSDYANGKISNAQIFNTALSGPEVETLYNYGSPIQTLANIPQNSNLKAWYKLDASEVYNSSTTEWSIDNNQNPSDYPSSLNFTSDVVQSAFPGPSSLNSSVFSYSIWVKVLTSAGFEEVLMGNFNGTGADIRFKGNENKIYFRTGYSSVAGYSDSSQDEALVDDGGWHHIVATCDGTNLKIYVDKAKGTDGTGSYTSNTIRFQIGGGTQGNMQNILISNACYFNTALSQSEIDTLYNNGTPLTDMSSFSSLVSWWKLNNTTTGIQDSKGSNNLSGSGPTEYTGFVNALAGDSSGMSQTNLVQSDLQTVAPYSKYAIKFEAAGGNERIQGIGRTLGNGFSELSISAWVKYSSSPGNQYWPIISKSGSLGDSFDLQNMRSGGSSNGGELYFNVRTQNGSFNAFSGVIPSTNVWYNVVGTYNGSEVKIYINNSLKGTLTATGIINTNNSQVYIGDSGHGGYSAMFKGIMSNISVWDTGLTSSQVTEIYNEGLPSNLNNHSAYSNLVSWWQLGENSSFDGSNWLFADEKGSNNGESINMTISDLVNGVGTTANGVSNNMSEGNLVGDAPYSTANAISSGMAVTARGIDVP